MCVIPSLIYLNIGKFFCANMHENQFRKPQAQRSCLEYKVHDGIPHYSFKMASLRGRSVGNVVSVSSFYNSHNLST